jgi:hypothetical protein
VNKVEGWVEGPSNSGVMPFTFDVVLTPADVNSCGAFKAGDAITGVKIEPDVTDLQGREFGYAEAADGRQRDHEPVAVVPEARWPEPK